MTPERWQQVRAVFARVVAASDDTRDGVLAQLTERDPDLRNEVASLLQAHDAAGGFIDQPGVRLTSEVDSTADEEMPERLGRYRLEGAVGRGGMGAVYVAERDDDEYRKRVAIKILKRGLDTDELVRRFRAERQILANLDHPNITKLLDGGSTPEGRPYLVMELVEGETIDAHCTRAELDVPATLGLMRKVCDAVHFAHRNLVVHRDLKPSNILITADGDPKLLDFGIAKLLDPDAVPGTVLPTRAGSVAMTPAYASPEQIDGRPVTTASDVYSLGVILYELISGRRPLEIEGLSGPALERTLRETRIVPPSLVPVAEGSTPRRMKLPRTDVDRVVLKALHREPERRYASADRLARDIDNLLAGRPVSARPDRWHYVAAAFVRRHRAASTVAATALAVLLAMVGALLVQQGRLIEQRNVAQSVSGFLVHLLETADPTRSRGETITVREVLDQAARDIDRRLLEQPTIRSEIMDTLGRAYNGLGLYAEATRQLEQATELRRQLHGAENRVVADSLHTLGVVRGYEGDFDAAEQHLQEALEVRVARLGDGHPATLESEFRLAWLLEKRGRYRDADRALLDVLDRTRQADDPDLLALILDRAASVKRHLGDFDAALGFLREALATREAQYGELDHERARISSSLAVVLVRRAEYDEAETLLDQAETIQRQLYGDVHPELVSTIHNIAWLAHQRGDYDAAEKRYRQALDMAEAAYGGEHAAVATALANLAVLSHDRGRSEEAEALHRQALDMRRRMLGPRHPELIPSLTMLGAVLRLRGDHAGDETLLREALEIAAAIYTGPHPETAAILHNLCLNALRRKALDEARGACTTAVSQMTTVYGDQHPDLAMTLNALGDVEIADGHEAEAEAHFTSSLGILVRNLGEDHPTVARARIKLGHLALRLERPEVAADHGLRALAVFESRLAADDIWMGWAHFVAGLGLEAQGDPAAVGHVSTALPIFHQAYGPEDRRTTSLLEAARRLGIEAQ